MDKKDKKDPGELPSAPEKKSVLRKARARSQEPGPHGPNCRCKQLLEEHRFCLSVDVDILCNTKEEADMITRAFEALGVTLHVAGFPVNMTKDLRMKAGDDGREEQATTPVASHLN